jgi:hypothetical protein
MNLRKFFSHKGQTSVEYILILSVAISLGITVFNKLNEHLVDNPNGMIGKPLNSFKKQLDSSGRYRQYPMPVRMGR